MKKRKKMQIKAKKSAFTSTRRDLFKTMLASAAAAALPAAMQSAAAEEECSEAETWQSYDLRLSLYIPRIYNNNESNGYRKYQRQVITGKLFLGFSFNGELVDYKFSSFINNTHKLSNGKNVTYRVELDKDACWPRFNAIGSNKTGLFKTASVCFAIGAEPSYNIGEYDEDTSLFITLAGKGKVSKSGRLTVSGYAAGSLGCGCMAYGHISPTRRIGKYGATAAVVDVAAVHGTWRMKPSA